MFWELKGEKGLLKSLLRLVAVPVGVGLDFGEILNSIAYGHSKLREVGLKVCFFFYLFCLFYIFLFIIFFHFSFSFFFFFFLFLFLFFLFVFYLFIVIIISFFLYFFINFPF